VNSDGDDARNDGPSRTAFVMNNTRVADGEWVSLFFFLLPLDWVSRAALFSHTDVQVRSRRVVAADSYRPMMVYRGIGLDPHLFFAGSSFPKGRSFNRLCLVDVPFWAYLSAVEFILRIIPRRSSPARTVALTASRQRAAGKPGRLERARRKCYPKKSHGHRNKKKVLSND
jgi:hypothetical protein